MVVPFPSPTVIAHRGASAYAPEHSFAAFDLAIELGADVLELDVRPLADGRLVVCHDATLQRTCEDSRAVGALTTTDLSQLDPDTRPRTLLSILRRYAGRVGFLVELKNPTAADVEAVLADVREAAVRDSVVLQSFDHAALRALHALDPEIALCALYPKGIPGRLLQASLGRASEWLGAVAPCSTSVDAALVRRAHTRGLRVFAYTVNEPAELERLTALAADGLITDVPDLARDALASVAAVAA